MSALERALGALVVLAVPVVLVALNVRLMTTEASVRRGLGRVAVPPSMTAADRDARGVAVADYVAGRGSEDEAFRSLTEHGQSRGELQNRVWVSAAPALFEREALRVFDEVAHLEDVRVVVGGLLRAAVLGLAVVGLAGALALRRPTLSRMLRTSLGRGGVLTLALVALVGLGVATGWERTFVLFHELLFPQGNWAFPADSLLIQLFPDRFWFEAAVALVGLTCVEAAALAWWGRGGRAPRGRAAA